MGLHGVGGQEEQLWTTPGGNVPFCFLGPKHKGQSLLLPLCPFPELFSQLKYSIRVTLKSFEG